jgi:hypothetical protein
LPDLTNKFREIVGMDELASSPSSPSSIDDIGPEDSINEEPVVIKETKQRPVFRHSQSDRFSPKRSQSGKSENYFFF